MGWEDERRLHLVLRSFALGIGLLTVVTVAASHHFTAFYYDSQRAQITAHMAARALTAYAFAYPETWTFAEHRIEEALSPFRFREVSADELFTVVDAEGNVALGRDERPWLLERSLTVPLNDGRSTIGHVTIHRPTGAIWLRSGLVGLLGLVIGAIVFLVLQRVPLQALREREAALEGLRRSAEAKEHQLRLLTDAMPFFIVRLDRAGNCGIANRCARTWLASPGAALLGSSLLENLPAAERERYGEVLGTALSGQARAFDDALTFPDGVMREVAVTVIPDHDPDGETAGAYLVMEDMTEPNKVEAQLRQLQRTEAIGQLTGGVAHDFNNILGIVSGNLELLEDHIGGSPDADKLLTTAARAVDRGAELTARLLAFARRQRLDPRPVQLSEVVPRTKEFLTHLVEERIKLSLSIAADTWPALVDPGQLENALINLVINARDAIPSAGRIELTVRNVTLDENYAQRNPTVSPGDYVEVAVRDTGTGMSRDIRDQAFNPFFTTKDVGEGSGLGLPMVYGFLKQSGGHVEIDSEENRGTAVRLFLPRAFGALAGSAADDAAPDVEPEAKEAPRDPAKILVVEDAADLRELAEKLLVQMGYRVISADNAASALALLSQHDDVDLLFTDVILPGGMHGGELARQAQAVKPALKVIYTSGYTDDTISHHGELPPNITLLTKPYRRKELAAMLDTVLNDERTDPCARSA